MSFVDNPEPGIITFSLSGSPRNSGARPIFRLDVQPLPSQAWKNSRDMLVLIGWLLFVEAEVARIGPQVLPITMTTIMGRMGVYFEHGVVPRRRKPHESFTLLGKVELSLSIVGNQHDSSIRANPHHKDFDLHRKEDGILALMLSNSVEAISEEIEPALRDEAFYAMTFGLEKWARDGLPRPGLRANTWAFPRISKQAEQGRRIVEGGWLTRGDWPLNPFYN